jgi:hypothetical protein
MPKLHDSITQDRISELIDRAETTLDSSGLCVACGADAAKYIRDCCGRPAVYGVELIGIMTF